MLLFVRLDVQGIHSLMCVALDMPRGKQLPFCNIKVMLIAKVLVRDLKINCELEIKMTMPGTYSAVRWTSYQ